MMMQRKYKRGRLPPHPAVWWSRIKLSWPALLWIGAIILVWFMLSDGGTSQPLNGVVDIVRESVSPLETGRLVVIRVDLGDRVQAGDILAEMDTTLLDAELAFDRLQAERQFTRAVLTAETDLHDTRVQQARDEAELQALNVELMRLEDLLKRNLIDGQLIVSLRIQQQALSRAVELHPEMISFLEQQVQQTRALQSDVRATLAGGGDVGSGIPGPEHGLLRQRREVYTLRARQDGVVSQIEKEPGEVVQAGEPILSLVVEGSQFIIGFVPEWKAYEVEIGREVILRSPSGHRPAVSAVVTALGPEILSLPTRVSPIPGQPVRGRRLILTPSDPSVYLPGESVSIHLYDHWWKGGGRQVQGQGMDDRGAPEPQ